MSVFTIDAKDDNNDSILKWSNHLILATVEQMQTRNKVASLRALVTVEIMLIAMCTPLFCPRCWDRNKTNKKTMANLLAGWITCTSSY